MANFSTSLASVVDTGGKFATRVNDTGGKQREQLSNCWQINKWTWKKKFIHMLTLQPKGVQKKSYNFSDWRFFPFSTGVNDIGGASWAVNISANFREKFFKCPNGILRVLEATDWWKKTWSQKSRGTVPLRQHWQLFELCKKSAKQMVRMNKILYSIFPEPNVWHFLLLFYRICAWEAEE